LYYNQEKERGKNMNSSKQLPNETSDTTQYVEVWEDVVSIKDLVLSLIICTVTTLVGYFIVPDKAPLPLFSGLTGSLVGFLICSFIFKPKRIIETEKDE